MTDTSFSKMELACPRDIEERAIALFERHSLADTGHKWLWPESTEEVRNRYRLFVLVPEMAATMTNSYGDRWEDHEHF